MCSFVKTLSERLPAGCRRQTSLGQLIAIALLLSSTVQDASAVTIPLVNGGFDDTSLPGDNLFDFLGSYNGWAEVDPGTGAANQVTNVGPINLHPSDLTVQHESATNVLYYQEFPNVVRVDQTTTHAIGANETYTLSVWAGNDLPPGRFGGYSISLYADDGTTKTVLKTLSGGDIADDALVQKTLTLVDDVDLDLAPYSGQLLGVGLSSLGDTYLNPLGNPVPGIVFYDSVNLEVNAIIPEPSGVTLVALGLVMFARTLARCRRN